jgi:hypothetical protein
MKEPKWEVFYGTDQECLDKQAEILALGIKCDRSLEIHTTKKKPPSYMKPVKEFFGEWRVASFRWCFHSTTQVD